ncbi:MAG: hypothetical protein IJ876_05330 [Elusimicrobiaceae bacterium]|nr:hypothetical protein [Elusimicrobiaceae bacterium]
MAQSIENGIGFLKEAFSKLKDPTLPKALETAHKNLRNYSQTHFLPACLALEKHTTCGMNTTVSQLRAWRKQVTEVFDRYDDMYGKLIEELDNLLKIYPVPIFFADKKK